MVNIAACDVPTAIITVLTLSICADMRSEEDEYKDDHDHEAEYGDDPVDSQSTNVSKEDKEDNRKRTFHSSICV
ncbi:unnamed protein product [Cylicostephanus goldi]|uniref:Uncharacterized protein n=1 Tax=Cylicostephanus goldi TaxID=71465 RepID=A0A3P6QXC0_CYLGO|nr:unnamed protein product [Cylicostephanus goldi]